MALNTIADLSTTAASNTDFLGSSTVGSVADANTIDTIVQKLAAIMARAYGDIGGLGSVAGSANAITLTSLSTYQALENGLVVSFKAGSANTGATTLNLDGLGAKAIRKPGDVALTAGEIAANGRYMVIYDEAYDSASGAWVLTNPGLLLAAVSDYRSNVADKVLETDTVWSSAAEVTLTDASTIAVDMSTFINATVTLGANRTLGAPTNAKVGQTGRIRIVQDATGSRTMTFNSAYKFATGANNTLSTAANAEDLLYYDVITISRIHVSLVKGVP